MTGRLLPLLAALAAAACVTEPVADAERDWTLTAEEPTVVAVGGEADPAQAAAQLAAARAPQSGAEPAQDQADLLSLIEPARPEDVDADYLQEEPSPFHRLGRNVIRGIDGSWSKLYTLKPDRSVGVLQILQTNVPGFPPPDLAPALDDPSKQLVLNQGSSEEGIRWVLHPDFYTDSTGELGERAALVNPQIADLLVVTAPAATLLFIDQLLDRLLADLPQIEIQVRIVEVNLDDVIEWDAKVAAYELENSGAPFDPDTNPPDGNFGSGFPILEDGDPTGAGMAFGSFQQPEDISGFLMSLQGVYNDLNVKAILSLLQTIGASELISSPTVTVLNGHRAMINTGRRVPVYEATGLGSNSQVTTKYEDTGVRVEIIPFIVGEDVIRIDLSVAVSAVTGEEPFNLAGVEVNTPIISTRDTGTTVHVHSGQVLAVGGLRSRDSIETITKVPVLGDIPILGWLFKSRSSRMRNSEIVFFITPTIRIPSETLVAPPPP
ncbi:MAG TPA: type II and III secretion system protein [Planctomycetota bacterium]|nr:type II and III secretion system protein [Planctomycetota bacterium]